MYIKLMKDDPLKAYTSISENEKLGKEEQKKAEDDKVEKEVEITKPLVHFFYLWKSGFGDKNDLKKIFEYILLQFFRLTLKHEDFYGVVKPDIDLKEKDEIKNYFLKQIDNYFALADFRKDFNK